MGRFIKVVGSRFLLKACRNDRGRWDGKEVALGIIRPVSGRYWVVKSSKCACTILLRGQKIIFF